MHELSIAMCLLDAATEESERRGGVGVSAIHIKLGPLSGVMKEALVPAFELAREGTDLGACRLVIEEMPVVIRCSGCQANRTVVVSDMCCPVCGAPPAEIVAGQEMDIVAMEIYDTDYTAAAG